MTRTPRPSLRATLRVGAVLLLLAPATRVRAGEAVAAAPAVSALRAGETVRVEGIRERRFSTPGGATFRALPGSTFTAGDASSVRLVEGTLADVNAGAGRFDVQTNAFVVRADRATVYVRALPGGVYAEHQTGSTGTVTLVSAGRPDTALAPGTFRMAALDDAPAAAPVAARTVPTVPSVATTSFRPATSAVPSIASAPVATATARAPMLVRSEGIVRAEGTAGTSWVDSQGTPVVPAPGPCLGGCNPCAPPVIYAPCAPPPVCTTGCGEMITTSGVPVPDRADDTGRVPLGTALGARGPCNSCAGTECNRIPYVHYVEGLVCDVTTYKVGCCLITVRPASRVRVHRLPDGSLEMWAPNIGKDLALIEINENQFGYIGEDGFLVIGNDCQIEYFRGLVHLYTPRRHYWYDRPKKGREKPTSEDRAQDVVDQGSGR
jgi:hypothetical protein